MSFDAFGLSASILKAISAEGYVRPTAIQALAIPEAAAGKDVLGLAQTGTGKTAAFALPMLHRLSLVPAQAPGPARRIRGLILVPTRELAQQVSDSLSKYGRHTGLRNAVVYGGVGINPQIAMLARGVDILVATPGRLIDLQRQGRLDLRSVEMFVLDEADRMLDIGFLPDIRRIASQLPTRRQTLLFSATMPAPIAELADTVLREPVRVRIPTQPQTAGLITQSVCFVQKPQKSDLLTSFLSAPAVTRALVFTKTKHGADRVARQLTQAGIKAEAIHGNKTQAARQRSLNRFREDAPPVLVATDVAARGIDVDAISHVVNYDLPMDPETYVHRIGRTGRAGAKGIAVSFCDDSERDLLAAIEKLLKKQLPVQKASAFPRTTRPVAPVSSEAAPSDDSDRPWQGQAKTADRPALGGRASAGGSSRPSLQGRTANGRPSRPGAGEASGVPARSGNRQNGVHPAKATRSPADAAASGESSATRGGLNRTGQSEGKAAGIAGRNGHRPHGASTGTTGPSGSGVNKISSGSNGHRSGSHSVESRRSQGVAKPAQGTKLPAVPKSTAASKSVVMAKPGATAKAGAVAKNGGVAAGAVAAEGTGRAVAGRNHQATGSPGQNGHRPAGRPALDRAASAQASVGRPVPGQVAQRRATAAEGRPAQGRSSQSSGGQQSTGTRKSHGAGGHQRPAATGRKPQAQGRKVEGRPGAAVQRRSRSHG